MNRRVDFESKDFVYLETNLAEPLHATQFKF